MNEEELKDFAELWYRIGICYYSGNEVDNNFNSGWKQFTKDYKNDSSLQKRFKIEEILK